MRINEITHSEELDAVKRRIQHIKTLLDDNNLTLAADAAGIFLLKYFPQHSDLIKDSLSPVFLKHDLNKWVVYTILNSAVGINVIKTRIKTLNLLGCNLPTLNNIIKNNEEYIVMDILKRKHAELWMEELNKFKKLCRSLNPTQVIEDNKTSILQRLSNELKRGNLHGIQGFIALKKLGFNWSEFPQLLDENKTNILKTLLDLIKSRRSVDPFIYIVHDIKTFVSWSELDIILNSASK